MGAMRFRVDVEVYEPDDGWAQAKYLVHGYDDVLWTDDAGRAAAFIEASLLSGELAERRIHE
jgi:hypothetical protein